MCTCTYLGEYAFICVGKKKNPVNEIFERRVAGRPRGKGRGSLFALNDPILGLEQVCGYIINSNTEKKERERKGQERKGEREKSVLDQVEYTQLLVVTRLNISNFPSGYNKVRRLERQAPASCLFHEAPSFSDDSAVIRES